MGAVDGDIGGAPRTGRGRGTRIVRLVATPDGLAPKPSSDDSHPRAGRGRGTRTVRLLRGNTKRTDPRRSRHPKARTRVPEGVIRSAPFAVWWRHRAAGIAPRETLEGSHPRTGRGHSKRTVCCLVATPGSGHRAEGDLGRLAPRIGRTRRQRIARLVATPDGQRAEADLRRLASRLRQCSPTHSTVPTAATEGTHPRPGRRRLHRTAPLVATPEGHRTEAADGWDAPATRTRSNEAHRLLPGGDTGRQAPAPRATSEGSQPLVGRGHSTCTVCCLVATPERGHRTEGDLRRLAAACWTRSSRAHRSRFRGDTERRAPAPTPTLEGTHTALPELAARGATVPTALPDGTHRERDTVDGDIDASGSHPADRSMAASPQRLVGGDTGLATHRGCWRTGRTADRTKATSPQRFTGGDTSGAPHRGRWRTGRTPRTARWRLHRSAWLVATPAWQRTEAAGGRDAPRTARRRLHRTASLVATPAGHRTEGAGGRDAPRVQQGGARGAPPTVVTPRAPSVAKGRATASAPTVVATPPDARLRSNWVYPGLFRGCRTRQPDGTSGDGHRHLLSSVRQLGFGRAGGREVPSIVRDTVHHEGSFAGGDIGKDHSVKPVGSYPGLRGNEWWRASGVVL